jgi:hypothetical protein
VIDFSVQVLNIGKNFSLQLQVALKISLAPPHPLRIYALGTEIGTSRFNLAQLIPYEIASKQTSNRMNELVL